MSRTLLISRTSASRNRPRPTFADIENFTGEQYDEVYEDALAAAINRYIINTSICVDNADAIFIRPSEIIAALATVMAQVHRNGPARHAGHHR